MHVNKIPTDLSQSWSGRVLSGARRRRHENSSRRGAQVDVLLNQMTAEVLAANLAVSSLILFIYWSFPILLA